MYSGKELPAKPLFAARMLLGPAFFSCIGSHHWYIVVYIKLVRFCLNETAFTGLYIATISLASAIEKYFVRP